MEIQKAFASSFVTFRIYKNSFWLQLVVYLNHEETLFFEKFTLIDVARIETTLYLHSMLRNGDMFSLSGNCVGNPASSSKPCACSSW